MRKPEVLADSRGRPGQGPLGPHSVSIDGKRLSQSHGSEDSWGKGASAVDPTKLHADKWYDYPHLRRAVRRRGIVPRIARRGIESSKRLGRFRWVVERTP